MLRIRFESQKTCMEHADLESDPEGDPERDIERDGDIESEPWVHFDVTTPLKHIQESGKDWILHRERVAYNQVLHGGFFCDPPGMGKTLTLIAAVQENPGPIYSPVITYPCITLVVCPPQVINVWATQLSQHTNLDADSIVIYHGTSRKNWKFTSKTLFVITSYYILRNEFDDGMYEEACDHEPDDSIDEPGFFENSIFNHNYYRIILDETDLAKNRKSKFSIAMSYLKSTIKWVVTATPRINNLDDEFSYYRFLRVFSTWSSWREIVPNSSSHFSPKKLEMLADCKKRMAVIQQQICLIRDKSLLNLPPKTEEYLVLQFTPEEQKFYDSLQIYALSRVEKLELAIQDEILKECASAMGTNVLLLIYRLKMATTNCMFVLEAMPRLKGARTLGEATQVLEFYNKNINRNEECAVCLDKDADHIAECGHKLCCSCWDKHLKRMQHCPFCRHPIPSMQKIKPENKAVPVDMKEQEKKGNEKKVVVNYGLQEKSTKLNKLMEILDFHVNQNGENAVIVSQSIKTLNYIGSHVNPVFGAEATVRIDGKCKLEDRNAAIDAFQNDNNVRIMYYSLTCNPEGITLTRGTVLIHVDQWWNKTGKVTQVNDRIHRITQTKPTKIYYLTIDRTIETNILKLQTRKEKIINYQFEGQEVKPRLLNHDFDIAEEADFFSDNE